ncbi:unannotated protein [freshwater metagenome]|uniref:Unannotated protein n=1 Tax=freshwater metagenome TaxID=449393 RepID=A0A6J7T0N1_9ZZZZ|nr:DUF4438 domain-containing protein [Actinomycetota bacterium]
MKVSTNVEKLVTQILVGEVWPPLSDRHGFRIDANGHAFLLPGMGGVTLGVHCGDIATRMVGDHIEPGLSIRHSRESVNYALQFLTCIGNIVTVTSGPSRGKEGFVIGQHAYVLVDMTDSDMSEVTTGDTVSIRAIGQGLKLIDHPNICVKNVSPQLLDGLLGGTNKKGTLDIHVARKIPPQAIGAGSGMVSEYANTDFMGAYPELDESFSLGLESLRIGDVVAMIDQDHSFGRGYREGWITIGVISTGSAALFGHGPGPSTIMSGPAEEFNLVIDESSNIKFLKELLGA